MGEKLLRSAENTGRVGAVAATLPRAAIEQPQAVSPGEIQMAEELLKSQSCLESHMDAVHREAMPTASSGKPFSVPGNLAQNSGRTAREPVGKADT